MPRARLYPVTIQLDNRRYTGEWELMQGGEICVGSAYGSKRAPVGRRRPELVAADVLAQIVKDWQRKREREARQIERQTLRVARTGRPSRPKRKV